VIRDVTVATHYWSPGWASALDEYLRARAARYRWIGHPLFADGSAASYHLYEHGELVKSVEKAGIAGPSRYLGDVRRTLAWARLDGPTDLFIAGDNLIALAGLRLRSRGLARAVVLYTIDFVPQRFRNLLANRAYHGIDRFAVARADVVWNTASGIVEGRRERDGARRQAPQLIVPIGAHVKRIVPRPVEQRRPTIAYLGHLLEKQGLQVVIQAMPEVLRRRPGACLLVIGDGPYRARLEALTSDLGVAGAVEFTGFHDDHAVIEELLLDCSLGVAPYEPGDANYSRYQDLPGKIVTYLACGLPVITTTVPRHGHLLESSGSGQVSEYSPMAMADAIDRYLSDPALLTKASECARHLGLSYDWDEIFDRALSETGRLAKGLRDG
jgi:glycosyltransferase involved in cell wall biosynthesis